MVYSDCLFVFFSCLSGICWADWLLVLVLWCVLLVISVG